MNFLFSMLSVILIIFIIYNLNIIRLDKSYYIVILLISSIIIVPLLKYENLGLPILSIYLIIMLYFKTRKSTQTMITIFLSLVILMIADTTSGIFLFKIFFLNNTLDIRGNFIYYITHYFLVFTLSYFICYILKKSFLNKVDLTNLSVKKSFSIFLTTSLLLTFMIFYINTALFRDINKISKEQETLNLFMFLLYLILLILIYHTLYKNLKKEAEFINRQNEFEIFKEYTQNMESYYKEMRKFKHDYINILSSISGYIEHDDMNGLRKHFEENVMTLNEDMNNKDFKLDRLQNIEILELKGIISAKIISAYKNNIDVFIDIPKPVRSISMHIIDLCRIIGILLDNAIEASKNTSDSSIEIGLIDNEGSITIVITNSCSENTPQVFMIYKSGFSTKGSGRGLGLSNLKEILFSYKNTFLDTYIEDGRFIQVLEIQDL